MSDRTGIHITLPTLGRINLRITRLARLRRRGRHLAALEIIEWPVAAIIAAGHLLAAQRRSDTLHAFGEALEQA